MEEPPVRAASPAGDAAPETADPPAADSPAPDAAPEPADPPAADSPAPGAAPETDEPVDGEDTGPPDRRGLWVWVGAALVAIAAVVVAVLVRGPGSSANPSSLNRPVASPAHTSPPVPQALRRPLRLPKVAPGGRCPTSKATPVANAAFGGVSFGSGAVRVVFGNDGALRRGVVQLDFAGGGWWTFNTLWYTARSYQGSFLIRARRLDGAGPAQAGGDSNADVLFVPRGHTATTYGGVRTMPSSTWVRTAGCYGWQIDGRNFTDVIVVDAVTP